MQLPVLALIAMLAAPPEAPTTAPVSTTPTSQVNEKQKAYARLAPAERAICDRVAKTCLKGRDGSIWNKAAFDRREREFVGMSERVAKLYDQKYAPLFYNLNTDHRARSLAEVVSLVTGEPIKPYLPPEAQRLGCNFVHKVKVKDVQTGGRLTVQRFRTPGMDECESPEHFRLYSLPPKFHPVPGAILLLNIELRKTGDPAPGVLLSTWAFVREIPVQPVPISSPALSQAIGADIAEAVERTEKHELVEWYVDEKKSHAPGKSPPEADNEKMEDQSPTRFMPKWAKTVTRLNFASN